MNIEGPYYDQARDYEVNQAMETQYSMLMGDISMQHRATREFVPADKKDEKYWFKRVRNNASARKSRMKRKAMDKVMERKLLALQKENIQLRNELAAMNIMHMQRSLNYSDVPILPRKMKEGIIRADPQDWNKEQDVMDDDSRSSFDDRLENESKSDKPNESNQEDDKSNSSGKSEMDDFRNDCPSPSIGDELSQASSSGSIYSGSNLPKSSKNGFHIEKYPRFLSGYFRQSQGYLSLPLNAQAMMSFPSTIVPYMMMENMENSSRVVKENHKEMENIQVPHKIRIKEKLHSAFNMNNKIGD